MKRKLFFTLVSMFLLGLSMNGFSQKMDYTSSKEYIIRKLTVETPSTTLNKKVIITQSGLIEGMKIKIPGEDITNAIDRLWEDGVCTNIKIYHTAIEKDFIDLVIYVEETPRVNRFSLRGPVGGPALKKTEADELYEHIRPIIGQNKPFTEYLRKNVEHYIKDYFADKNYFDTKVEFEVTTDTAKGTMPGGLLVRIMVDKKNKVKVGRLTFEGNDHVRLSKIRRAFKESMYEKSRFDVWKDLVDWVSGKKKSKKIASLRRKEKKPIMKKRINTASTKKRLNILEMR